ncbi:hypothetical protein ACL03H_02095 [Saccharopolyspora sp. MS10]|uniref:hypothetical protein n=1 Tax=Saccharopolyspora sp. MS10 TaxID=3385973 RepID=UPI0039A0BC26
MTHQHDDEVGSIMTTGGFLERLHMRQRITFLVNRYEIRLDDGSGGEGELVAFAEQKRARLKEQVTLFTDERKEEVLASFQARKVLDLASGYDVRDGEGNAIGFFRKDFRRSLTRSTWDVEQPGSPAARGAERSLAVAVLRRAWEFLPFIDGLPFPVPYHFDFTAGGRTVLSVRKKFALRDRYVIDVTSPDLDRRLVIAQAVALDALQSR